MADGLRQASSASLEMWAQRASGGVGVSTRGREVSVSHVLVVVVFVLHQKRGRVGTFTLRAQIVVSTIPGMTVWPWHLSDLNQS